MFVSETILIPYGWFDFSLGGRRGEGGGCCVNYF